MPQHTSLRCNLRYFASAIMLLACLASAARAQRPILEARLAGTLDINVEAQNFKFVINSVDNPEITVPRGSLVRLSLTSRAGSHDWVLANAQGALVAQTNRVTAGQPAEEVEFTANDIGTYSYYCSVGAHRDLGMAGRLVVVANPPSENALASRSGFSLPESGMHNDRSGSLGVPKLIRNNPSEIYPPFGNLYSHGVEVPAGMRTLHIAGQAGVAIDGTVPGDADSQLDLAWGNIKAVLKASGMTTDDLVKVTCYVADEKYTDAYARSVDRHLGKLKPAMTAPVVRQLWSEKWFFEIDAVAAAGPRESGITGGIEDPRDSESVSKAYLRKLGQRIGNDATTNRQMGQPNRPSAARRDTHPLDLLNEASPRTTRRTGEIELVVDYHTFRIGKDDVRLRCYNKELCGPTIRAKAGDTVYITLRNKLPVETNLGHGLNTHHMWNTTNLHFHGLHISPQGPDDKPDEESDNVLLELEPTSDPSGSVKQYALRIPADHVAGTFWYHAHRHGSTAGQVASGMSGPFIIERADSVHNLDSVPAIREAGENIMLLQQIPYLKPEGSSVGFIERSSDGSLDNDWASDMLSPGVWHGTDAEEGLGRYVTVNGKHLPTITIQPGEVRRLRLIHSGQRERIALRIERAPGVAGNGEDVIPFHEIAVDGLPTGDVRRTDKLDLYPGYRSDALIQPSLATSGEFYLVDTTAAPGTGADGSPEQRRWIAKLVVAGPPKQMNLPLREEVLPHRVTPIDERAVQGTQYAFYGIVFTKDARPVPQFFISQSRVDVPPGSVPSGRPLNTNETRPLELNRTERWVVGTRNGPLPTGGILQQFHPFHIHTNPFFIEEVSSPSGEKVTQEEFVELGGGAWRDTLAMKQGYTYSLLTQYKDFTGSFVNHCHILDHEDNGMMELVTIEAPTNPRPVRAAVRPPFRHSPEGERPAGTGRPSVQLFVKGSFCRHCMTQVTDIGNALADRDVDVSVVSASSEEDLKAFPRTPFRLVADPELTQFRKIGALKNGDALHAVVVLGKRGDEKMLYVGEEPLMDAKVILSALANE